MTDPDIEAREDARVARRARWIVGGLVAGALALTAIAGSLRHDRGFRALVLPAAVAGAASPVIGFRAYRVIVERAAGRPSREERRWAFLRAHIVAASSTGAAAALGALVHALSADPLALIGTVMHGVLAGALWPTDEKLALYLDATADPWGAGR